MLRELYIENGFKHHQARFRFEPGLTAIVGPNGRGKSLIMEFVRFALFGTKALRGSADDYKKLKVELIFDIRGETYKVTRAGTRTALHKGDQQLAAGTRPVDEKIRELFGYDLIVFDVANACNQGAVEALSNMKPAERKKMVDETIGLNVLDNLIASENAEALTLRRIADLLEKNLLEPVEPEAPDTLWTIETLGPEITRLERQQARRAFLQGQTARPPTEPTPPLETADYLDINALTEHEARRRDLETRRVEMERRLTAIPLATATADYYAQQRRLLLEWQTFKEAPPFDPPTLTKGEIAYQKTLHEAVEQYKTLRARFDRHSLECPECRHTFVPGMTAEEQALLATPPDTPRIDIGELREQERRHRAWEQYGKPAPNRPAVEAEIGLAGIEKGEAILARQPEREALLRDISNLPFLEDKSDLLLKATAREARQKAFQLALTKYQAEKDSYDKAVAELAMTHDVAEELSTRRHDLAALQAYERNLEEYTTALKVYQERLAEVQSNRSGAEDHTKASTALKELKTRVKSYLLPSLARVASVLVSQMTGGQHQTVTIDDDFNIAVDGQSVQTLSGSGKAVTNLALRIGLGQVLTNQVFSVFMADEFDASMDAERAKNTMNSLKSLLKTVSQIVVVSHKSHEANHFIDLGG